MHATINVKYQSIHLAGVALLYMILFIIGLSFVSSFSPPYFPEPSASAEAIVLYFKTNLHDVRMCAFFQFCSAIPLGIFTAMAVGRLNILGPSSSANNIALFGGFINAFNLSMSSMVLWVMAHPGTAADNDTIRTLYYLMFIIGGVGYSVPMGLLIGGIALASRHLKGPPRWLTVSGFALAAIGLISSFYLIIPAFLYLIPLTRFPGFIWLILMGYKIRTKNRPTG